MLRSSLRNLARLASLALLIAIGLAAPAAWGAERESYPPGSDVVTLTENGSKVGPLDTQRVKDKYTVFDVYADWCGPCRLVDRYLHALLAARRDVAVRRLNVVNMESPLAEELGPDFEALPYLIVFTPDGHRREIVGFDQPALDAALGVR